MNGKESKDQPVDVPPEKSEVPEAPQPDITVVEPPEFEAALSEGKGMIALPVNDAGDVVNQLTDVSDAMPSSEPPPPPAPPAPPAESE